MFIFYIYSNDFIDKVPTNEIGERKTLEKDILKVNKKITYDKENSNEIKFPC